MITTIDRCTSPFLCYFVCLQAVSPLSLAGAKHPLKLAPVKEDDEEEDEEEEDEEEAEEEDDEEEEGLVS